MSAADRLQAFLERGEALIPSLLGGPDRPGDDSTWAPDVEVYLRTVKQAADTHLAIMKLRAEELAAGTGGRDNLTVEEVMAVLMTSPVTTRRDLAKRLLDSVPAKGMVPGPKKG